jgi:hypothetical protein
VGHRLEDDKELGGQRQRQVRLLARRQLDRIESHLLDCLLEACFGQIYARTPEDLAVIFPIRQRMWIMRRDPPYARADRECHVDHLVKRWFVARGAEGTIIFLGVHALQRGIGVEYAAATRAQHVPRQFEQADAGGMQEGGDGLLLVEPVAAREGQNVDAAEVVIRRIGDQPLDDGNAARIRRLAQN